MIYLPSKSDRKINPDLLPFRRPTHADLLAIKTGDEVFMTTLEGTAFVKVKVTSVKTWVRDPDRIRFGLQRGLYDKGYFMADYAMTRFLIPVREAETPVREAETPAPQQLDLFEGDATSAYVNQ